MVIFVNDDGAYRSWVTHHRGGFVLDGVWKRELAQLVLHRATCEVVRGRGTGHVHRTTGDAHLTTGGRIKAYGLTLSELVDWASQRTGVTPESCSECQPGRPLADRADARQQLSHLASSVLDYVLDVAVIHLDDPSSPYRLTVSDVARCHGKSTAQLENTLNQLIHEGLIIVVAPASRSQRSADRSLVLPTPSLLRTLPAFSNQSPEELATQIAILEAH
ncbi:MAG: hypothetical protein U0795_17440 [Pirellulales bacterium]